MITWKKMLKCIFDNHGKTGTPPFSLTNEKEVRRWLMTQFGVGRVTVYVWKRKDCLPPYVRQSLITMCPEVFAAVEFDNK